MELRPYGEEDLALTEALECDPEVMRELGGPVSREDIPRVHRMRVETAANDGWYFAIVPEPGGRAAGQIGIFGREHDGGTLDELGWMVLPSFQGRGIATDALGLLLERARAARRFDRLHAFPGVTNGPSNALCRRFGFELIDRFEVTFRDRPLRVNHWVVDVGRDDQKPRPSTASRIR
jgi:RimJ/RimL family protein N-acetyltransferase